MPDTLPQSSRQGGHPRRRVSLRGFCRPPRRYRRNCCPWWTGRSFSTSSRRRPAAGIGDILLVTGRGKTSMVDHFDRQPYLESRLEAEGRHRTPGRDQPPSGAGRDLHLPPGRAARPRPRRLLRGVPCGRRSRSWSCWATSSSRRTVRCCRRCSTLQARTGGIVLGLPRGRRPEETRPLRRGRGRADARATTTCSSTATADGLPGDRPGREAATGRRAEQPRRDRPLHPAADHLRRHPADQAGRRRRDPAHRRDGPAAGRRHAGARDRLPGRPVRHRSAAGLPAGRGADRRRGARTSAPAFSELADGLRRPRPIWREPQPTEPD